MGYNFIEETITRELVSVLKDVDSNFYQAKDSVKDISKFVAAHSYLGMQAAERERIKTLNTLAAYFPVDLYTRSDTSELEKVRIHGGVKTLTEMPKILP